MTYTDDSYEGDPVALSTVDPAHVSPAPAEGGLAMNEARAREVLDREWRLLVGGELRPSQSGATFAVTSPYAGDRIALVPDGGRADVDAAVASAKEAFTAWSARSAGDRADTVLRLADAVERRGSDLALLDAVDGGAPIAVMANDVAFAVQTLRYFAGLALELKGTTTPASENLHFTERCPYGVVAKIIPFNHPALFAISKVAAPLVAGNSVVLKPAEATPLSALLFGEICRDVLPAGLVNVVVGDGPLVPDALVRHRDVHRIGFTGSEATGRAIQRAAAEEGVKQVTLELGGKNALIAFPDADPAEVAEGAVRGMNFTWSGQSCGSTSRLLVHSDIADEVLRRIAELLADRVYESPLSPSAVQGTVVNRTQYHRILDFIEAAVAEGAKVVLGGGPAGDGRGLFVAPTVLDHVRPDHRIANEEVFGPVLSVIRWTDEREAIDIANSVRYGLTGSVYTNDIRRAHRVTRALETGYVWINGSSQHFMGVPFGGWKNSGIGHEEALEELFSYSRLKSVNVMLHDPAATSEGKNS